MAERDPKQFRPAGDASDRRNFDADDDPLVELARIVSEDGGFYSGKAQRAVPMKQASAEDRDAFSADLEAELMQELEFSMRSRQEQSPTPHPQFADEPPARLADPPPVAAGTDQPEEAEFDSADVSFDQASAEEDYKDPGELLRELQKQLGGFGHRIVTPAEETEYRGPVPAGAASLSHADASNWDSEDVPATDDQRQEADAPYYQRPREEQNPEPYSNQYDEAPQQENPFLSSAPGEWVEDPFMESEPEPSDFPEPEGAARSTRWPSETGGWEAVTANPSSYAPEEKELQWSGSRRTEEYSGEPDAPDEPARAAPAWAAPAAVGYATQSRRGDTGAGRPVSAGSRDAVYHDTNTHAGLSEHLDRAANAERRNEDSPKAGADWLTSGRDIQRELRPTVTDFGDALKPANGRVPVRTPAPAVHQPANEFDTGPGLEDWTEQPFDSDADDLDRAQEPSLAPVQMGGARASGRSAGAGTGRGSRRALLMVASLAGVVLIGGALAAYLRSGESVSNKPPPVIRAEEGAVKVEAQNEAAAPEQAAGDVVYNPPANGAPAQAEQLVETAEEPREVARVVLPPPQAPAEEPLARPLEGQAAPTDTPPDESIPSQNGGISPIGPRRVRTVVVRPDGTIVANSEATAPPSAEPPAAAPPAPGPDASAPDSNVAAQLPSGNEPVGDPLRANPVRTTAITAGADGQPANPQSIIAADAAPEPSLGSESQTQEPDKPPTAAEVQPPTPAEAEPEIALGEAESPTAVAPPAAPAEQQPAPAEPPAQTAAVAPQEPAPADGFVVQLSSQRSDAQARSSFDALKRQYPNVLGQFEPNIQQADLGAKGTFYRVRVGPMPTRAEAIRVCEALKAAGGTCFVGK